MKRKNLLYLAWAQSLIALLGSLYFSNYLNLPPCLLCWYQRIFVFPQVILLTVGIILKDHRVSLYSLSLLSVGWIISLYHNLIYYHLIPDTLSPCISGVSCTTRLVEYFGFLTIPLLSFLAQTVIITCLVIFYKANATRT